MKVTVSCRCPLCGKISFVACEKDAWDAYEAGALAQEAFTDLTVCAREAIISGMCANCQASFFEEDDEGECDGDCEECEAWAECPNRHES